MIPVDRRDQHDAVRPNPEWVDVVPHVLRLAERVVGVAGAGPVAERRRGREAGFAGVDVPPILGAQARKVELLNLDAVVSANPGGNTRHDRKRGESGRSVAIRVANGGRRYIKKTNNK